jgi:hypothetical protein
MRLRNTSLLKSAPSVNSGFNRGADSSVKQLRKDVMNPVIRNYVVRQELDVGAYA